MTDGGLLERDAEIDAISRRLERTAAGEGGLVLLRGSAGAGKTALLRHMREVAGEAGVRVLQAVGGELEREFAFGLVRQLFEPVVLTAPADERERLLSGAAAMAGPVVGAAPSAVATETSMDSSFATLHGLYWLVAALSESEPLLLVVDDAHWGDAPSLRFIDFLARRATELPVLVAVAMRPNEPGAEVELLARLADGPDVEVLSPAALSADAVRRLVDDGLGQDVGDDVVEGALDATRGNPLLLRELVRSLASTGATPTAGDVRAAVPSSVTHSVNRRVGRLPDAVRDVAHALAVLGDRVDPAVIAVAVDLEREAVADAIDALVATELVEGDPPRFVHPLVRQAIAERVVTRDRDRLHHRAAEALRDRPGQEEDLVVHLLASSPLGADWVVPALRAAAERARAEGAPDAALRRIRRAIEEYGSGPDLHELHLLAGRAAASAGYLEAIPHLAEAANSDDPMIAAEAAAIQTTVDTGTGELPFIVERLRTAIERLGKDADVLVLDNFAGSLINAVTINPSEAHERGRALEDFAPIEGAGVLAHRAFEAASGDEHADVARGLARQALADRPFTKLSFVEYPTPLWALTALGVLDGKQEVDAALRDAEATTVRHPTPLGRGFTLFMRGEWALTFDSISRAESDARECLAIFTTAQMLPTAQATQASLIQSLVWRGELAEADRLLAEMPQDDYFEDHWSGGSLWLARADLRLAQGRPEEAVQALRLIEQLNSKYGWKRFARGGVAATLARALTQVGRADEAREIAQREAADARRRGVLFLEAHALIALALTETGDAMIETLQAAQDVAARTGAPLLEATARFELGAALRRSNRRVDARTHLAEARDLAHRYDATALVNRATEELTIAGGRPRRIATSGVDSLSPSERRVAEHAARGLSNREIAETLFVTRKTVEFQLGATYQKLGIRSRTQLSGKLGLE